MALYDSGEYANQLLTGDIHTTNMEAAGLPSRALPKLSSTASSMVEVMKIGASLVKMLRTKAQSPVPKKTRALAKLRDNVSKAAENRGYLKVLDGRRVPVRHKHASLNTFSKAQAQSSASGGSLSSIARCRLKALCLERTITKRHLFMMSFDYSQREHYRARRSFVWKPSRTREKPTTSD